MPGRSLDYGTRFAKNAAELLASRVGRVAGSSGLLQNVSNLIKQAFGPQFGKTAIGGAGVALSALFQAPNMGGFFERAGFDGNAAQGIIDEVVDTATRSAATAMANGQVNEAQADQILRASFDKVVGGKDGSDQFSRLISDPREKPVLVKTVVDPTTGTTYVVHIVTCPACKGHVKKHRKGGTPAFAEGVSQVTVAQALDNKYVLTTDNCCSESTKKLFERARRVPMNLFECVASFPTSLAGTGFNAATLRTTFYAILRAATAEQRSQIQRISRDKVWTDAQLIATWLLDCQRPGNTVDVERFMNLISLYDQPASKGTIEQVEAVLDKAEEGIDKARRFCGKTARRMQASSRASQRKQDVLNRILNQ